MTRTPPHTMSHNWLYTYRACCRMYPDPVQSVLNQSQTPRQLMHPLATSFALTGTLAVSCTPVQSTLQPAPQPHRTYLQPPERNRRIAFRMSCPATFAANKQPVAQPLPQPRCGHPRRNQDCSHHSRSRTRFRSRFRIQCRSLHTRVALVPASGSNLSAIGVACVAAVRIPATGVTAPAVTCAIQ